MRWVAVEGRGRIWTWTRCWHPVHPALRNHGPYIAVLVELPHAGNVDCMLGNPLGDARQEIMIGAPVVAVFEPHDDAAAPSHPWCSGARNAAQSDDRQTRGQRIKCR